MTQTWDCTDARPSLGVYVLGAIDPAERALVDAHLATCRECRDELAGLAGLPALLARVNPDEISRICADDAVRHGHRATGRRRSCSAPCSTWPRPAAAEPVALPGGRGRGRGDRRRPVRGLRSPSATETARCPGSRLGVTALGNRARDEQRPPGRPPPSPTPTSCGATRSRSWWITSRWGPRASCGWSIPTGRRTQVAAWTTARDEGKVWYGGSMASTAGAISTFQITGEPGAADRPRRPEPAGPRPQPGMDDRLASVLSIGVTGG